jgi:DNA-binding CsgD family transcriptional regulator
MNVFVGRTDELAALAQTADAVLCGEVAVCIVVGDPGSGKSRLLGEAAARADVPNQFRVVGFEPESGVPLAAASEFLRALAAATPHGCRLEELVFGAAPDTSPLEPVRVFEAVHRAFRAIGPALVLVDDLQWLDELSLALCHYLVRAAEAEGEPLAVCVATRPSSAAASFTASIRHLLPPEHVRELELRPLDVTEALELVKELAPRLGDDEARAVAARSGGSPFWLEALARGGGAELDVDRLVTARLRGVSPDAARLLALLAIAARPLAIADAAELGDWDEARTQRAARELIGRGVAVDSAGLVRLAHDLIRDAAAGELAEEQRTHIHGRVGDWLVESAGDDIRRLQEALGHRHAAGLGSLDLANRVARAPRRKLLGDDGVALLVAIADEADPFEEAALALNEGIAALALALGRHDIALERNLLLADRRSDPSARARALLEAAKSSFALHKSRVSPFAPESDRTQSYLARARELGAGDELLELEIDVQQATVDIWADRKEAVGRALAHETAVRAERRFSVDEHARRVYVEALRVAHEAAVQEDDPQAMLHAAERRAAVAKSFDEEEHLTALLASARAFRRMGRIAEALERSERVYREARTRVFPRLTLDAGYWLATFLLQSGRVADADDVAASSAELASRIGDEARGRHAIERVVCEVEFHGRDWRAGVDRLLAYARKVPSHGGIELHQLAAMWVAFAGGRELADEVRTHLVAGRACADAAGCWRCATELRLATADALAHVGCRGEAAESLAEWVSMQPRPQPRDLYLRRRVEALLEEPVSATELDEVAGEAEKLGFALDALWTRLDLADALVASDRARAKDLIAAVAEVADSRGARVIGDAAGMRLRSLGVRTWQRGAGVGGTLTDRERSIAHLITEGASNPEIARQLFLSRKTVERHVSNVLKKVGVRNRAELAARVAERGVEGAPR